MRGSEERALGLRTGAFMHSLCTTKKYDDVCTRIGRGAEEASSQGRMLCMKHRTLLPLNITSRGEVTVLSQYLDV